MTEMTPFDWAIRPLKRLFDYKRRAPRAEYWWFYLATIVIGFAVDLADRGLGETGALTGVFNLAFIIPWLSVSTRRLHDINRSGWWLVVTFIAIVVAVAWMVMAGQNLFVGTGLDAMSMSLVAMLIVTGILCIVLFVFSVLPGDVGSNDYGPDPYGPDSLEEVFA